MSAPATKQKHPSVHHRDRNNSTLGKQFDSQDEQPWLEIWGGLTHQKNSLHFQSKPLIDAICSPMLNRVLERLPGMPIKIILNLKLRIHSSLNGLRRLRPLLIMWFKLH